MSANIPFEIQTEILKRVLHVKSLIRFRSVSKQWKSLIDSSEFINHHSLNHPHPRHLLVSSYVDPAYKYVSIDDDDSFPLHQVSLDASPNLNLISFASMYDSSHGLLFFYGESEQLQQTVTVIWNPSIRKSVAIVFEFDPYMVGFGVCPKTGEPTIVSIMNPDENFPDWEAEVFTLTSGVWRSISMNLQKPFKKQSSQFNQVVVDGVIHWLVYDNVTQFIVSFDLTTEEFGEIDFPDGFTPLYLFMFKLNESLAILNWNEFQMVCDVWTMINNGDSKFSFAKLFTYKIDEFDGLRFYLPIGFRKNGQLIRELITGQSILRTLEVYDPCTKDSNDIGIDFNTPCCFKIIPYTESLLLLNHSDSIIQG